MGLIMVGVAVYGVLQLALLSWPVRASRVSTILLGFVVGAYGTGVLVLVVTLAWWRIGVEAGGVPEEVSTTVSRHVAPLVEELAKVLPLLVAGWLGMRRQWGVADFVVLGAAVGAGFGLLETLFNHPPDPASLTEIDGGWMGQARLSLTAPFYPFPSEAFTSWLPSSTGVVDLGLGFDATIGTVRHVPWGIADGLAVGLFFRARAWRRSLAVVPLAAAVAHHWGVNNRGVEGFPGWAGDVVAAADDGMVETATCLLILAMVIDWRHLRWGKATVPGVLLAGEHRHRVAGLAAPANRYLPHTTLAVLRFARARRALCYAAARTPTHRLSEIEPLRAAIAETAALIDNATVHGHWDTDRIRSAVTTGRRAARRGTAHWVLLGLSLLLTLPSLLYLGIGNFPSTRELGEWFTRPAGLTLLFVTAVVSLALTLVVLVWLIRSWRSTRAQPIGEPTAALGLRLAAAVGGLLAGSWLLFIRLTGTALDEEVLDTEAASLFAALDELLFGLSLALFAVGLFALFPPAGAGALALVGGGTAGSGAAISANLGGYAIAAGILGGGTTIALNEANSGSGPPRSSGSTSPRDVHNAVRKGERDNIDEAVVWRDGDMYINSNNGNMIKVLDKGDGTSDIVIKDASNPSGQPITRFNAPNNYVQRRVDSGEWF
ncbi:PrsW family glutamic-type intramembrane protease [Streptomyces sp. 4N509B]|uniref:PrsW family glutamic-type intramembrane protease n=1 Tax=Streptomyces sp. 4N509B TaxID=3457413 RepID=UPI003FD164DB